MTQQRTDASEGGRNPVRAKKSLGQNFLTAPSIAELIAKTALQSNPKTVFEIGPGTGMLTRALLANGAKVTAVEKDEELYARLREEFSSETQSDLLTLICGDALVETPEKLDFKPQSYSVAANIPYYITGMLFRLFLEKLHQPSIIVFLVQKEVAEEIVTRDGKEGILSLSVKAYGKPRYVSKVKKEAFSPPPKVDSAILAITDINRKRVPKTLEKKYFAVVKAGLGSRRKMLFGNLARVFPEMKTAIDATFTSLGIAKGIRGEDLSFEDWLRLVRALPETQNKSTK